MPYLGSEPGAITDAFTDTFTGDGSETAFTLSGASTTNAVFVRIHGVVQRNGTDFNVDGTTLTFTTAPPNASNNIVVQFFAPGSILDAPSDNSITLAKLAHGTDGNLISYDTSGAPVAVATGSDGQVLTSAGAGAAPAFETLSGLGKVVQSLYSEYAGEATLSTTIPLDDTISQVGEGTELFSQAITASNGSNIIEISAIVHGAPQGTATLIAALFLDGGDDAIYACVLGHDGVGGNAAQNGTLRYRVAAADTSEHTYTVRVGCHSGAWFPNSNASGDKFAGTAKCTMVVTEYSA